MSRELRNLVEALSIVQACGEGHKGVDFDDFKKLHDPEVRGSQEELREVPLAMHVMSRDGADAC